MASQQHIISSGTNSKKVILSKEQEKEILCNAFNVKAPISKELGMRIHYEGDSAVVEMEYNKNFNTSQGNVHGGVNCLILDSCMWFTAALLSFPDENTWLLTSTLNVNYLKAVYSLGLRGVGKVIKQGKLQHVVEGHLYDSNNQLVAHATGVFTVVNMAAKL